MYIYLIQVYDVNIEENCTKTNMEIIAVACGLSLLLLLLIFTLRETEFSYIEGNCLHLCRANRRSLFLSDRDFFVVSFL